MNIIDKETGITYNITGNFIDKPKLLYRKFAYRDIHEILNKEGWKLAKCVDIDKYRNYIISKINDYDIDADYILLDKCKVYNVKEDKVENGCELFKYHALVICRELEIIKE